MKVVKLDDSGGYREQVREMGGYAFIALNQRYKPGPEGMLLSLKELVKIMRIGINLPIWWPDEFDELKKELLDDNN